MESPFPTIAQWGEPLFSEELFYIRATFVEGQVITRALLLGVVVVIICALKLKIHGVCDLRRVMYVYYEGIQ